MRPLFFQGFRHAFAGCSTYLFRVRVLMAGSCVQHLSFLVGQCDPKTLAVALLLVRRLVRSESYHLCKDLNNNTLMPRSSSRNQDFASHNFDQSVSLSQPICRTYGPRSQIKDLVDGLVQLSGCRPRATTHQVPVVVAARLPQHDRFQVKIYHMRLCTYHLRNLCYP